MTSKTSWTLAVGIVVLVVLLPLGCRELGDALEGPDRDCVRERTKANAEVRTDRAWQEHEIPGIGDYLEVHYLQTVHAESYCLRGIPGQWEWYYEGVIRLRPEDVETFRASHGWIPGAPHVDPLLAAWTPDGTAWLDSGLTPDQTRDRISGLYLDPDAGLLYFTGENLDRPEPKPSGS